MEDKNNMEGASKEWLLAKIAELEGKLADMKPAKISFTIEDIKDRDRLEKMVDVEATNIYESARARKDRSKEDIVEKVRQGKVAELYLIETGDYFPANKKWHDLKDKNGDYVEVKAYNVRDQYAPFVQSDLRRLREEGWNISKWYMLFQCIGGKYNLIEKIKIRG